MFTERQYERFINRLKDGMTISEASKFVGISPSSMKEALEKVPEVKQYVDDIILEGLRSVARKRTPRP